MESLDAKGVLEFMDFVMELKHLSRRGWELSGVKDHERIASHMYSMAMMTFLIGEQTKSTELNRLRCLELAVVHDLAEAITGDITPHDGISVTVKHHMEDEAIKRITLPLGPEIGGKIYTLYKEYEAKETPESRFVKDLDRLDLILTADYYEKRDDKGKRGIHQEYFNATHGKFEHPFVKQLVEALNQRRGVEGGGQSGKVIEEVNEGSESKRVEGEDSQ